MNLYEINREIEQLECACEDGLLIDAETGELILFEDALNELRMARAEKIENIALWIKNLASDVAALEAEEERLMKRRNATEAKIERLKAYLQSALVREDGTAERFSTPRCTVTVRRGLGKVIVTDEKILPAEFFEEVTTRKVAKMNIKEVLSRGIEVPGAHLEQTRSVIVR